ncbi:DUF4421 family protein [Maribacter sp. 2308TA10-17]|uniref:DUF4421 family protein n=1 Tax=Maribacter sp. 2308TA10-17 TaxID=3386276 RepID=UPI0039BCECE1
MVSLKVSCVNFNRIFIAYFVGKLHLLTEFNLILFISIISMDVIAQSDEKKDSTTIKSYIDKVIVKTNIDSKFDSYVIGSSDGSDLRLVANNEYRMFLSLDYEFIGVSVGFAPKILPINNDDNLKGKTAFSDYNFRFFLGGWTSQIQYQKVQGFYIENTNEFIEDWVKGRDEYLQLPGLRTLFFGGSTSYVLNPKFSLRNVVYNTEWQLKSAGSFVPTINYGYSKLSNDLEGENIFEKSFEISLSPNYYYTYVIAENWFLSTYISPSFGVRFAREGENGTSNGSRNVYWPVSLDGGIQLGYSAERWIFGANLNFESTWYREDVMTRVENDVVYAKIYFGYRFDAPKVVQKPFDWMNEKLGL